MLISVKQLIILIKNIKLPWGLFKAGRIQLPNGTGTGVLLFFSSETQQQLCTTAVKYKAPVSSKYKYKNKRQTEQPVGGQDVLYL